MVCGGSNELGQLDAPLGRYIAIDAHGNTTCAVAESGGAACWGEDESLASAPPGPYATVHVTHGYACGLTEGGEALCWGRNSARAHARQALEVDDTYSDARMPVPPSGPFVAMTLGVAHYLDGSVPIGCAASVGGEILCWEGGLAKYDYASARTWQADFAPNGAVIEGDFCDVNGWGSPLCNPPERGYAAIATSTRQACAITLEGKAECRWRSLNDVGNSG